MDPLFKEVGIYAALGQRYEPVDSNLVLSYREATDGQVFEEGITEAGSAASFQAAGTAYASHGQPMIPFYIFYSMFGFQRTGDLLGVRRRSRPGLPAGWHGRSHHPQRRGPAARGWPHAWCSPASSPAPQVYDPAFAYETAAHGRAMASAGCTARTSEDSLYYMALYNENHLMPARPEDVSDEDIVRGLYHFRRRPELPAGAPRATILSGVARHAAGAAGPVHPRRALLASPPTSGARRPTSCCATRRWRWTAGTCSIRWNRRARRWSRAAERGRRPAVPSSPSATGSAPGRTSSRAGSRVAHGAAWAPMGSRTERLPERPATVLRVDAEHVVAAVMAELARCGQVPLKPPASAFEELGVDPEAPSRSDPLRRST